MAISTLEFSFPRSFLVKAYQKRFSPNVIEYSASYITSEYEWMRCALITINPDRLSKQNQLHCQLQIPYENEAQSKEGKICIQLRNLSVDIVNSEIHLNLHDLSDAPYREDSGSMKQTPTIDELNFALPFSCIEKIVRNRGGSIYRSEAWYLGLSGVVLPCMLNATEMLTDNGEERLQLVFEGLILSNSISPLTLKFMAASANRPKHQPSSTVSMPVIVSSSAPAIQCSTSQLQQVHPITITVPPPAMGFNLTTNPMIPTMPLMPAMQTFSLSQVVPTQNNPHITVTAGSILQVTTSGPVNYSTTRSTTIAGPTEMQSDESYRSLVHIEEIIAKDFSPKDDSDVCEPVNLTKNREESPDLLGKIIEETILKDTDSDNSLDRILAGNPTFSERDIIKTGNDVETAVMQSIASEGTAMMVTPRVEISHGSHYVNSGGIVSEAFIMANSMVDSDDGELVSTRRVSKAEAKSKTVRRNTTSSRSKSPKKQSVKSTKLFEKDGEDSYMKGKEKLNPLGSYHFNDGMELITGCGEDVGEKSFVESMENDNTLSMVNSTCINDPKPKTEKGKFKTKSSPKSRKIRSNSPFIEIPSEACFVGIGESVKPNIQDGRKHFEQTAIGRLKSKSSIGIRSSSPIIEIPSEASFVGIGEIVKPKKQDQRKRSEKSDYELSRSKEDDNSGTLSDKVANAQLESTSNERIDRTENITEDKQPHISEVQSIFQSPHEKAKSKSKAKKDRSSYPRTEKSSKINSSVTENEEQETKTEHDRSGSESERGRAGDITEHDNVESRSSTEGHESENDSKERLKSKSRKGKPTRQRNEIPLSEEMPRDAVISAEVIEEITTKVKPDQEVNGKTEDKDASNPNIAEVTKLSTDEADMNDDKGGISKDEDDGSKLKKQGRKRKEDIKNESVGGNANEEENMEEESENGADAELKQIDENEDKNSPNKDPSSESPRGRKGKVSPQLSKSPRSNSSRSKRLRNQSQTYQPEDFDSSKLKLKLKLVHESKGQKKESTESDNTAKNKTFIYESVQVTEGCNSQSQQSEDYEDTVNLIETGQTVEHDDSKKPTSHSSRSQSPRTKGRTHKGTSGKSLTTKVPEKSASEDLPFEPMQDESDTVVLLSFDSPDATSASAEDGISSESTGAAAKESAATSERMDKEPSSEIPMEEEDAPSAVREVNPSDSPSKGRRGRKRKGTKGESVEESQKKVNASNDETPLEEENSAHEKAESGSIEEAVVEAVDSNETPKEAMIEDTFKDLKVVIEVMDTEKFQPLQERYDGKRSKKAGGPKSKRSRGKMIHLASKKDEQEQEASMSQSSDDEHLPEKRKGFSSNTSKENEILDERNENGRNIAGQSSTQDNADQTTEVSESESGIQKSDPVEQAKNQTPTKRRGRQPKSNNRQVKSKQSTISENNEEENAESGKEQTEELAVEQDGNTTPIKRKGKPPKSKDSQTECKQNTISEDKEEEENAETGREQSEDAAVEQDKSVTPTKCKGRPPKSKDGQTKSKQRTISKEEKKEENAENGKEQSEDVPVKPEDHKTPTKRKGRPPKSKDNKAKNTQNSISKDKEEEENTETALTEDVPVEQDENVTPTKRKGRPPKSKDGQAKSKQNTIPKDEEMEENTETGKDHTGDVPVEQDENATPTKRKGRPQKSKDGRAKSAISKGEEEAETEETEETEDVAVEQDENATPTKRKGRPPKSKDGRAKSAISKGEEEAETEETEETEDVAVEEDENATPTKRKGRPQKSKDGRAKSAISKGEEEAETEETEETEDVAVEEDENATPTKRKGRPPKSKDGQAKSKQNTIPKDEEMEENTETGKEQTEDVAVEQDENATPTKRKGRPPKSKDDQAKSTISKGEEEGENEETEDVAVEQDQTATPTKRKGRPPKSKDGQAKSKQSTISKGEEEKENTETGKDHTGDVPVEQDENATPTKRKGRPPKSKDDQAKSTISKGEEEEENAETGKETEDVPVEQDENPTPTKRKGRPPKSKRSHPNSNKEEKEDNSANITEGDKDGSSTVTKDGKEQDKVTSDKAKEQKMMEILNPETGLLETVTVAEGDDEAPNEKKDEAANQKTKSPRGRKPKRGRFQPKEKKSKDNRGAKEKANKPAIDPESGRSQTVLNGEDAVEIEKDKNRNDAETVKNVHEKDKKDAENVENVPEKDQKAAEKDENGVPVRSIKNTGDDLQVEGAADPNSKSPEDDFDLNNIVESIKKSLSERKSPAKEIKTTTKISGTWPSLGISSPTLDMETTFSVGSFDREWSSLFPWLYYDEENKVIFCKICTMGGMKNIYTSGSHFFSLDPLLSHTESDDHVTAVTSTKRSTLLPADDDPEWQEKLQRCRNELPAGRKLNRFNFDWLNKYKWLVYDEVQDKMFCKYCRKQDVTNSFKQGTKSFVKKHVINHGKSRNHQDAVLAETAPANKASKADDVIQLDTESDIIFSVETDETVEAEPLRWNRIADSLNQSGSDTDSSFTPKVKRVPTYMSPVIRLQDVSQSPFMRSGRVNMKSVPDGIENLVPKKPNQPLSKSSEKQKKKEMSFQSQFEMNIAKLSASVNNVGESNARSSSVTDEKSNSSMDDIFLVQYLDDDKGPATAKPKSTETNKDIDTDLLAMIPLVVEDTSNKDCSSPQLSPKPSTSQVPKDNTPFWIPEPEPRANPISENVRKTEDLLAEFLANPVRETLSKSKLSSWKPVVVLSAIGKEDYKKVTVTDKNTSNAVSRKRKADNDGEVSEKESFPENDVAKKPLRKNLFSEVAPKKLKTGNKKNNDTEDAVLPISSAALGYSSDDGDDCMDLPDVPDDDSDAGETIKPSEKESNEKDSAEDATADATLKGSVADEEVDKDMVVEETVHREGPKKRGRPSKKSKSKTNSKSSSDGQSETSCAGPKDLPNDNDKDNDKEEESTPEKADASNAELQDAGETIKPSEKESAKNGSADAAVEGSIANEELVKEKVIEESVHKAEPKKRGRPSKKSKSKSSSDEDVKAKKSRKNSPTPESTERTDVTDVDEDNSAKSKADSSETFNADQNYKTSKIDQKSTRKTQEKNVETVKDSDNVDVEERKDSEEKLHVSKDVCASKSDEATKEPVEDEETGPRKEPVVKAKKRKGRPPKGAKSTSALPSDGGETCAKSSSKRFRKKSPSPVPNISDNDSDGGCDLMDLPDAHDDDDDDFISASKPDNTMDVGSISEIFDTPDKVPENASNPGKVSATPESPAGVPETLPNAKISEGSAKDSETQPEGTDGRRIVGRKPKGKKGRGRTPKHARSAASVELSEIENDSTIKNISGEKNGKTDSEEPQGSTSVEDGVKPPQHKAGSKSDESSVSVNEPDSVTADISDDLGIQESSEQTLDKCGSSKSLERSDKKRVPKLGPKCSKKPHSKQRETDPQQEHESDGSQCVVVEVAPKKPPKVRLGPKSVKERLQRKDSENNETVPRDSGPSSSARDLDDLLNNLDLTDMMMCYISLKPLKST